MSADRRFRKVTFADIALHRMRAKLPSGRKVKKSKELSIFISDSTDEQALVTENCNPNAGVESDTSEIYANNEAGRSVGSGRQAASPETFSSTYNSTRTSRDSPKPAVSRDNRAPEQAITLFAFRLAILEKTARGAGTLTFVWATVVLLGGFSQYVSNMDFWVVTILLLTEGSRIFLLSNELELQRARKKSSSFWLLVRGSNFARRTSGLIYGRHPVHNSASDGGPSPSPSPSPLPLPSPWRPWDRHNGEPPPQTFSAEAGTSKRAQRIAATLKSKSAKRTWSASGLPILPYTKSVSAMGMASFLYIGQVLSALLCLALSLWRIIERNFLDADTPENLHDNIIYSLVAFYAMALLEAFIFLVERGYWENKINYMKLFEEVDRKAQLNRECIDTIRSFFYQVYSRNLETSVFAGLEMDLVSYSMELIQSNDEEEVLGGSKILKKFVEKSHVFQSDTLRRIGLTPGAIDRLVEMLAWHHSNETDIRLNSAAIVKALVSSTRNGSRVIAVSGSLQNIISLLQWDDVDRLLYVEGKNAAPQQEEVIRLRTYGLGILKCLARDHANCLRIGEARGLLAKLVDFINVRGWEPCKSAERCKTMGQSLQLLQILASTAGSSGSTLRPAIANVVSAIPHLRDILHTPAWKMSTGLHELAVDVLNGLALDKQSREVIGSTGGVVSNLMLLFTRRSLHQMPYLRRETSATGAVFKEEVNLANKSGEVLMRLALENVENCNRILRTRFKDPHMLASTVLLQILQDEQNVELGILAAQILRSTFPVMSPTMQEEVSRHSGFLLKRVTSCSDSRLREAALGLAIALPSLSDQDFSSLFENSGLDRNRLVDTSLKCLNHAPSTTRRPRIRRYTLELIYILISRDEELKGLFSGNQLPSLLTVMLNNISDVENYILFSGGMGLTRHEENMESLVLRVLNMFNVEIR